MILVHFVKFVTVFIGKNIDDFAQMNPILEKLCLVQLHRLVHFNAQQMLHLVFLLVKIK